MKKILKRTINLQICCMLITYNLYYAIVLISINCAGGVIDNILALSAKDLGSSPCRVIPNTMKYVFVVSPLIMHH